MFGINKKIYERLLNMFVFGGILLIVSFGISWIYFVLESGYEDSGVKTIDQLYWWWVETVFGIGAGSDPVSWESRIVGTVVVLISLILLSVFISEISAVIRMIYARKEEGNIKVNYKNHIVVFGYTSLTAGVIKLLRKSFGQDLKIVLITNDTDTNPFPGQVDFIHDNPIIPSTLADANLRNALAAVILANDRFRDPDSYSIVISSSIEKQNSRIVTIVEITDLEMRPLMKKTGIDAFIHRRELLEDLVDDSPNSKLKRIILKETILEEQNDTSSLRSVL